ncbi:unnamed protein product, partial [Ectocarpus sp. 12 AP-2014]
RRQRIWGDDPLHARQLRSGRHACCRRQGSRDRVNGGSIQCACRNDACHHRGSEDAQRGTAGTGAKDGAVHPARGGANHVRAARGTAHARWR